jgi:hypothetical protein
MTCARDLIKIIGNQNVDFNAVSKGGGDEDVLIVGREAMKILLDIALSMITKGFKDKNNIFFYMD